MVCPAEIRNIFPKRGLLELSANTVLHREVNPPPSLPLKENRSAVISREMFHHVCFFSITQLLPLSNSNVLVLFSFQHSFK